MIKDNIIYFGYGDIAVNCDNSGKITFQQFKPNQDIGSSLNKDLEGFEYLSELITLNFNRKDYDDLLNITSSLGKIFELDGYILDFTNYNQSSVNVVLHAMRKALQLRIFLWDSTDLSLAC